MTGEGGVLEAQGVTFVYFILRENHFCRVGVLNEMGGELSALAAFFE